MLENFCIFSDLRFTRDTHTFVIFFYLRYMHVISLKTSSEHAERFSYIVHPLAYRLSLNDLPGCDVDGMTWSIRNIKDERHFGYKRWLPWVQKEWGKKVYGVELFNDFT